MARDVQAAGPGEVVPFAVDFTRGQILRAVVQSKTPIERVREDGGPVGYVIISVGIFGLLLCLWKAFVLYSTGAKIRGQLKREAPDKRNPLGRVMSIYTDNPEIDIETLELKLDEAILRETAPLETGLSFIKVLYVVAPLLGLLGTVLGMLEVFDALAATGSNNPRSMAAGVSKATVSTLAGMVVAIGGCPATEPPPTPSALMGMTRQSQVTPATPRSLLVKAPSVPVTRRTTMVSRTPSPGMWKPRRASGRYAGGSNKSDRSIRLIRNRMTSTVTISGTQMMMPAAR